MRLARAPDATGVRFLRRKATSAAALALMGLVAGLLAACAVGPDFKRPAPPDAGAYGSAPSAGQTSAAPGIGGDSQHFVPGGDVPGQWWTLFRSPKLSRLVEQALKANPDLGAAQAALRQAHELYLAQRASLLPAVQGTFSGTRAENPAGTISNPTVLPQQSPYYNLYTGGLSISYTPDVFGLNRRLVEGAKAQAEGTRFQLEATYVTLSTNVVVTAIQEAALRGQIAATGRLLELQQHLTQTVQQQQGLGTASNFDLLTQQAAQAQTAATLAALQKQLGQSRDELTALLGRLPSGEPEDTFQLEDLTLPTEIPVSVPSKLVEQRPDVRQAQENLHAASAAAGVAIANMLPQFTLTGDLGSSALNLKDLFGGGTGFWDVGASLSQTLFDAGALLHKHRAADAALDQAGEQYRAAVILACQNVADSLRALRADADALQASAEAARAAQAALDLARHQLELGTVSMISVLTVEQTYRQAQLALVQAQASRYSDTAALFQALGGGWWNRPDSGPRGSR